MLINLLLNGQKKSSILETASTAIAEIAWVIEHKGFPDTAKKFVNEAFVFFDKLADPIKICHQPPAFSAGYNL